MSYAYLKARGKLNEYEKKCLLKQLGINFGQKLN